MDAAMLHARLFTLDSHIDIPWPNPADPFGPTNRRVDIVKMDAGGLRAGCFAAYIPQGPRTPESWAEAKARALAMLDAIADMGRSAGGLHARLATTVAEIHAARQDGAIAIVPVVENGHAIGQDLGVLAEFRARGVRYMTLTHNGHNAIADSCNPRADLGDLPALHGGLSQFGRDAIAEMNRLGILVDVSHASKNTMLQAAALSRTPVVATHSCIQALCPVARNLDDAQLDALRDTGGLVQITAVSGFVRAKAKPEQVSVSDYMDHLDYAVRRCGIAHVGISSDFDGGGQLADWNDASESGNLTAELVRRGYGESDIAALWGGNFLRLLAQAEAVAE
jgi:membrane dipeptidase